MKPLTAIDVASARALIDFDAGRGFEAIAEGQLRGAVAAHNILARHGFAYLADEVGMGKTYVALGAIGLMRFAHPDLRVLYITPRHNIQRKWHKELLNFTRHNWRLKDQRVCSFDNTPATPIEFADSLFDWASQAVTSPHRDIIMRASSFALALADRDSKKQWKERRKRLRGLAPVIEDCDFSIKGDKELFKARYAIALNAVLPHYDLVLIDEAHHLKHGTKSSAARNQMLALALGTHTPADFGLNLPVGDHFGRRVDRVLLLSATPIESDFRQLYNQLDLLGCGSSIRALNDPKKSDEEKRELTREFLVRRLTTLHVNGEQWTRNMYRREWRGGGMATFDEPLQLPSNRQRLIVALVQRKVADVLQDPKFNRSFQIGMLASFESFQETAGAGSVETPQFDDAEQTDDDDEREGVDRGVIAELAHSYRKRFGHPMPHPKMDAVAQSLARSLVRGEKSLVFVRRVRTVPELSLKLANAYDDWLRGYLRASWPASVLPELDEAWELYQHERQRKLRVDAISDGDDEQAGNDTFFSWFFRGTSGRGFLSGAAFRKNRLMNEGSAYSTMFEDNHLAALLGTTRDVFGSLAKVLGAAPQALEQKLRVAASQRLYESSAKRVRRRKIYLAVQEAGLRLLADQPGDMGTRARVVLEELYDLAALPPAEGRKPFQFNVREYVNTKTFFTELRRRRELCAELWPTSRPAKQAGFRAELRDREIRRELLASVCRLGHSMIDLWVQAVRELGTMRMGSDEELGDSQGGLVGAFLDELESQRGKPGLTAHRELSQVGQQHALIMATNFADAYRASLNSLRDRFGQALGSQSPIKGMFGRAAQRAVRQFRMPGYPLVLITTDVLQEGEDLHTFCSRIVHYGISWTPSSMEQRTGRIDRIGSAVHRRLESLDASPAREDLLQVHYPFLGDTVERLQVEVVFERMNRFLELLHKGLILEKSSSTVDVAAQSLEQRDRIVLSDEPLVTAFPVQERHLKGQPRDLGDAAEVEAQYRVAFQRLVNAAQEGMKSTQWRTGARPFEARGVVTLPSKRLQPFVVRLEPSATSGNALVRCLSPIGTVEKDADLATTVIDLQTEHPHAKLCLYPSLSKSERLLSGQGEILFAPELTQTAELIDLIERVVNTADQVERELFDGRDADPSTWDAHPHA